MNRARVTLGYGSYEMQHLPGKRRANEIERERKESEAEAKRQDKAQRKRTEEEVFAARWEG